MTEYNIAIDAGNGFTNAAQQMKRKPKTVSFPSTRAQVSGVTLGLDLEADFEWYEWNGTKYVVGDDIRYSNADPDSHRQTANRYGNEAHRCLFAIACARLGIKKGTVNLTTFMPVRYYRQSKDETIERIMSDNPVDILVKGDKKPRSWEYSSVRIIPEGIAALAAFLVDDAGDIQDNDISDGVTMLIDIGSFTVDSIITDSGDINPESIADSTDSGLGLYANIHKHILDDLKHRYADFDKIKIEHMDKAIRDGLRTGQFTINRGRTTADFSEHYNQLVDRYAGMVANKFESELPSIHRVILGGGGAVMVKDTLQYYFDGRIVDNDSYPSVKGIHPTMLNTIGGMRLAQVQKVQT